MSTRCNARLLLALIAVSACGCGSTRVGGRYLYAKDADPPRLLDGEVRVETFRRVRGKRAPDVRIIRCRDGVVTGSVESRRARERGEAELDARVWGDVWEEALWPHALDWVAEEADPKGSYYHLVTVRLGRKANQFSAQMVPTIFGDVIRQRRDRSDAVNRIVEILDGEIEVSPWEPPEEEQ